MLSNTIRWSKEYCEDLGEEDQDGLLDYAYRYFVYRFDLPNGNRIRVRQYTDEPDRGNLFMSTAGNKHAGDEFIIKENQFVSAIVGFLQSTEGITQFYYLAGTYKLLDISKLEVDSHGFSFMRVTE